MMSQVREDKAVSLTGIGEDAVSIIMRAICHTRIYLEVQVTSPAQPQLTTCSGILMAMHRSDSVYRGCWQPCKQRSSEQVATHCRIVPSDLRHAPMATHGWSLAAASFHLVWDCKLVLCSAPPLHCTPLQA